MKSTYEVEKLTLPRVVSKTILESSSESDAESSTPDASPESWVSISESSLSEKRTAVRSV